MADAQHVPAPPAAEDPTTDRRVVGTVVYVLAAVAVLSLLAVTLLAWSEKPIPDVLQNSLVGSITAVAALLARTSTNP